MNEPEILDGQPTIHARLLKMLGNIELGAHLLKTANLALKEGDVDTIHLRDDGDTAYKNIRGAIGWFNYIVAQLTTTNLRIQTQDNAARTVFFSAYDTDMRDCVKLINGHFVLIKRDPAVKTVEGGIWLSSVDNKVHFYDGAAEKILAMEA